jgi:hypothetical protein
MKLKSFGCSFVYGSDLDQPATQGLQPSTHTWPALLAQQLGYEYQCHARPGVGNMQIFDTVLREIHSNDQSIFVIAWTWIDRHDFQASGKAQWSTLRPTTESDLATVYYRDLHSQYRDQLQSLAVISTACALLKSHNIPFVMTAMDDLLWEQRWNSKQHLVSLQKRIRDCVTDFDDANFLNWSRRQGHDISKNLHPMHSAHQAAAEYILKQHPWLEEY